MFVPDIGVIRSLEILWSFLGCSDRGHSGWHLCVQAARARDRMPPCCGAEDSRYGMARYEGWPGLTVCRLFVYGLLLKEVEGRYGWLVCDMKSSRKWSFRSKVELWEIICWKQGLNP